MRSLLFLSVLSVFSMAGFAQQPADAFQVGSVSNTPAPASIDLSNASSRDLCVNTYVFDKKDDSFVSCCSTLLSPNQAYTMSTRIGSGTTMGAVPNSLTIKLVATHPIGFGGAKVCDAGAPIFDNLVSGMRATVNGTSLVPTQLASCVTTGPGQPCRTELQSLGLFCSFLKSTGSGFGLCQEAVPVQSSSSEEQKAVEMWHWTMYFH